MKRDDELQELKRDSAWEAGTLLEKVLYERKGAKKPFVIIHLEAGEKVKQEAFGSKETALQAFGGEKA